MRARSHRPAAGAATALLLVLAAGALGACGAGEGEPPGQEPGEPVATGQRMSETIPARIDPRPQGYLSADVLAPATNAWRTASLERMTEVGAGALTADPSTGAFAIFRYDFLTATQELTLVEVKGSGPVRITEAPLGKGIEESAQESGEISFAGERGVSGTLRLSDDSVSIAASPR
jgi:hypothetical protein